jgi:malate/lactate dehydrogenase
VIRLSPGMIRFHGLLSESEAYNWIYIIYSHREHGAEDVLLSMPSIIGVSGVEKRIEERWSSRRV